jgi:hypothetical protein
MEPLLQLGRAAEGYGPQELVRGLSTFLKEMNERVPRPP